MNTLAYGQRVPMTLTDWAIVGAVVLGIVALVVWMVECKSGKSSN